MIALLLTEIQKRLVADLADLSLRHQGRTPSEDFAGPPHVWIGDTPPKNGDKPIFPAVVLIPVGAYQNETDGLCTVAIDMDCTVYNIEGDGKKKGDTEGGEYDMANLMGWITRSLIKCSLTRGKGEWLVNKYYLVPDPSGKVLYWQKYAEQTRPLLQAVMHSVWQFPYME